MVNKSHNTYIRKNVNIRKSVNIDELFRCEIIFF